MREFKFRAWDSSWEGGKGAFNYYDMNNHDDHDAYVLCNVSDGDIEQYTGLKDSDGVEIYEGDIVNCPTGTIAEIGDKKYHEDGSFTTFYRSTPPTPYAVSSQGYAFFLGTKEDPKYAGIIDNGTHKHAYEIKVIGNIHENKELLEA